LAIGLIAQTGGIATVFGPPLAGHVIGSRGWAGFGWFLAAAGVIGALSLIPLLMRKPERGLAT
jgi:predicted MFS family arabinose efflux permease